MSRPAFDRDELLERVDGDRELLGQLAALFSQGLPGLLGQMEAGLRAGDGEATARAAHTLKGALLNLAAGPAAELARQVEDGGRLGNLDMASRAFAGLRAEVVRVESAVAEEAARPTP